MWLQRALVYDFNARVNYNLSYQFFKKQVEISNSSGKTGGRDTRSFTDVNSIKNFNSNLNKNAQGSFIPTSK